jgi:hypothetical protein
LEAAAPEIMENARTPSITGPFVADAQDSEN